MRALDRGSEEEKELVARRMRLTLQEVLGEEEGRALYTMDWLRARLDWHLDPEATVAEVLLACSLEGGTILGHTIVRVEQEENGQPFGLFSTTYVDPAARRMGAARALVTAGEAWLEAQGMTTFATDTAQDNPRLIGLFEGRGYAISLRSGAMVRLKKSKPQA